MGQPFGVAGYFAGPIVELQSPISVSDESLKSQVSDISDALELLNLITPKSYHFLQSTPHGNVFSTDLSYGFIAQEIQEVLPNLVKSVPAPLSVTDDGQINSTGDDLLGIKYTELIPILVAGMKEQQSTIDSLKQAVAEQASALENVMDLLDMMQDQIDNCCIGGQGFKSNSPDGVHDEQLQRASSNGNILEQNTPNPFRSQTTISYTLEQGGKVLLKIFDKTGKPIATLVEAEQPADTYRYEWDASGLPAGMYHYALYVDGELLVKRAIKL